MKGFVGTKKTLFLDKEAFNVLNDFEILIHDMYANGCGEAKKLISALQSFKSEFEEIEVEVEEED